MRKKSISPAVHKASVRLRKGDSVAGLAESERGRLLALKAENASLRKENTALKKQLRKPATKAKAKR